MKGQPTLEWGALLSDMVLETGLPYEVVAGFTREQFTSMQAAVRRRWEMLATVNGLGALFGGTTVDDTENLERKVKHLKEATGKDAFDLWEVV